MSPYQDVFPHISSVLRPGMEACLRGWPFCDLRAPWGQGGNASHSYSIQNVLSLKTIPVSEWHSDSEMLGRASGVGVGRNPSQTCRELPLCLPVQLSSLMVVEFSIWLEQRPLAPGLWAAHRGMAEHAGSGQEEQDQNRPSRGHCSPDSRSLGCLVYTWLLLPLPGHRLTLSFTCPKVCTPGTCLVLCLVVVGLQSETLQLLLLPLPAVRTFEVPEDFEECLEHQRFGSTTKLLTQTDFPLQAYEPKVQVPFMVLPGQCPRKIEIERYGWGCCGRACPLGGGVRLSSGSEGH